METPMYASVPYIWGTWTVAFAPNGTSTSQLQGYGDFPAERFPDIYILEFNKAKLGSVLAWLSGPPPKSDPGKPGGDLSLYLLEARTLAIPVRRNYNE